MSYSSSSHSMVQSVLNCQTAPTHFHLRVSHPLLLKENVIQPHTSKAHSTQNDICFVQQSFCILTTKVSLFEVLILFTSTSQQRSLPAMSSCVHVANIFPLSYRQHGICLDGNKLFKELLVGSQQKEYKSLQCQLKLMFTIQISLSTLNSALYRTTDYINTTLELGAICINP